MSEKDARFADAAERTFAILRRCTAGGLLYGGPQYRKNGQKPCIHHTFCHAAALADAIHAGISEKTATDLPHDEKKVGYRYYPELNTYLIRAGAFRATLTGYDYVAHTFARGAAHAGGGTISLLYKDETGPIIAGSVLDYERTEPNNMQAPTGEKKHSSLLFRAEYEKEGVRYATCLDKDAEITVYKEDGAVTAHVRARFLASETLRAENEDLIAEFSYRFTPEGVTIKVGKLPAPVRLILPVIEGSGEIITKNRFDKQPIFFLTGGFSADEYAFSLAEEMTVTIK